MTPGSGTTIVSHRPRTFSQIVPMAGAPAVDSRLVRVDVICSQAVDGIALEQPRGEHAQRYRPERRSQTPQGERFEVEHGLKDTVKDDRGR